MIFRFHNVYVKDP